MYFERSKVFIYGNTALEQFNPPASPPSGASATWPTAERPGTSSRISSSAEESAVLGRLEVSVNIAKQSARPVWPGNADDLECPICGAHEMLPLAQAIVGARMSAITLKDGLESGRYHLHCSLSGHWLVCRQSLESSEPES